MAIKRKRRRPRCREMKPACIEAQEWVHAYEPEMAPGVTVEYREFNQERGRPSLHVMFKDEAGRHLVDYWPGKGTVKIGDIVKGERRQVGSPAEALALAVTQLVEESA